MKNLIWLALFSCTQATPAVAQTMSPASDSENWSDTEVDANEDEIIDLRTEADEKKKAELVKEAAASRTSAWLLVGTGLALSGGGMALTLTGLSDITELNSGLLYGGLAATLVGSLLLTWGLPKLFVSSAAVDAAEAEFSALPSATLGVTAGGLFGAVQWKF